MSNPDLMWVTGLFEGEGTISKARSCGWVLAVSMTDRDIIDRLQDRIAGGSVRVVPRGSNKTMYQWRLCGKRAVLGVLTQMLPHLGKRRHARASEAIQWLKVSMTRCRKHTQAYLERNNDTADAAQDALYGGPAVINVPG